MVMMMQQQQSPMSWIRRKRSRRYRSRYVDGCARHHDRKVGRKSLTIKELLSLTPGSVVSFDRSVTEPMDIMINGTLVARGEVVSADGKFGLRLVDVVSPKERLEQLG